MLATGGLKRLKPPSGQFYLELGCNIPCCSGNPLEPRLPPCNGNIIRGTRLIAVPNGNNVEDWAISSVTV